MTSIASKSPDGKKVELVAQCDSCGRMGSWTAKTEQEARRKAAREGWTLMSIGASSCDECANRKVEAKL